MICILCGRPLVEVLGVLLHSPAIEDGPSPARSTFKPLAAPA